MLPNEEFALACRAYYDEIGLVVDEKNGQFAHCPLTRKECDTGYYLLWAHHQQQGLLQSKDLGKCCFFPGHVKQWLMECNPFPDNYFELWDIYEEYVSLNGKKAVEKLHAERDELGRSVFALKLHEEKDELGRSLHTLKLHEEKDEFGRSLHALKAHSQKDELGRSVLGVRNAERLHEEKDELGRSVNSLKGSKKAHAERDELGRSALGVKNAERLNREKDHLGRSVQGVKNGERLKRGGAVAMKKQRGVQLIRIEDGEVFIFDSQAFAAEVLNIYQSGISAVCTGKRKTVSGYTATYWDG